MIEELQAFGLSEKEAQVYLAALELGKATADELAKHASVKRPTTYVVAESLQKQGLMSVFGEGKKTYFVPESPGNLRRVLAREKKKLELRQEELHRMLPELTRMFEGAGERPVVRFYDEKEGITTMREEALHDLKKGDTLYVMYTYDALVSLYTQEEVSHFSKRREEKGVHIRSIYSRSEGPFDPDKKAEYTERRFLSPDKFTLSTDFFIFGNKVGLMTLKGNIFGVVIESKSVAQSIKTLFELIWGIAEIEEK